MTVNKTELVLCDLVETGKTALDTTRTVLKNGKCKLTFVFENEDKTDAFYNALVACSLEFKRLKDKG
jgi:hypothetical protein